MASTARHLESHVPVTLVFLGSGAQFDGASDVTPIAFGRGNNRNPQTFFYTLPAGEDIGRINVYEAIAAALGCSVPVNRPQGAPIEGLRYSDTNEMINAFLLWTADMFHAELNTAADTINHHLDLDGVDEDGLAVSTSNAYRDLPLINVLTQQMNRADQEIVIPGSVLEFTSDAAEGTIMVRLVLFPITNPGSLGEQCQQMAIRNMLGSVPDIPA